MSEKTERFNELFNQIGDFMQKELDLHEETFDNSLKLFKEKNKISYEDYQTLNSIRKMRNTIIHATSKLFMAEPFEETINKMENILNVLQNPPKILDYCSDVEHKFSSNDKIYHALRYMRKNDFSQVPIVDNGIIIGLLSMETIARWLDENIKNNTKISDSSIISVHNFRENNIDFYIMSANSTVYEAIEKLEESLKKGSPLKAIIVTNYGSKTDRIFGILTPFDLIKFAKN